MREYTSLLELVRSEPLISENIKATYHDVWQPKYKNVNVRYVYKTTIIEGLNIYMTALCKANDVIYIYDWSTTPLERYEELIKKHVISHIKVAGNLEWFNNFEFASALTNKCVTKYTLKNMSDELISNTISRNIALLHQINSSFETLKLISLVDNL